MLQRTLYVALIWLAWSFAQPTGAQAQDSGDEASEVKPKKKRGDRFRRWRKTKEKDATKVDKNEGKEGDEDDLDDEDEREAKEDGGNARSSGAAEAIEDGEPSEEEEASEEESGERDKDETEDNFEEEKSDEASTLERHNPLNWMVPQGRLSLNGLLAVNMSAADMDGSSNIADPVSLVPDIFYGLSSSLTLGLAHSYEAISGFWKYGDDYSHSICIVGTCGRPYRATALLVRWAMTDGENPLVLDTGLEFVPLWDPTAIRIKAGVRGSTFLSKLRIDYMPHVRLTALDDVSNIDPFKGDETNHVIALPVTLGYPLSDAFWMRLQTGVLSEFSDFLKPFDAYEIPLGVGGLYRVDAGFWAGANFNFANILGVGGTADARSLQLVVAYAL
jgi:hypothetical protein